MGGLLYSLKQFVRSVSPQSEYVLYVVQLVCLLDPWQIEDIF